MRHHGWFPKIRSHNKVYILWDQLTFHDKWLRESICGVTNYIVSSTLVQSIVILSKYIYYGTKFSITLWQYYVWSWYLYLMCDIIAVNSSPCTIRWGITVTFEGTGNPKWWSRKLSRHSNWDKVNWHEWSNYWNENMKYMWNTLGILYFSCEMVKFK